MSVQVGPHCYATKVDAGPAACASFVPVSVLSGTQLTIVGCQAVNADGSLLMYRSVADTSNMTATVVTNFSLDLAYPDCIESQTVAAFEALAGPFLALLVACWGLFRIASYLGWGRASES